MLSFICYYTHMPIGKVQIYRLLFVCLCVCTMDFSAEDKASSNIFCTTVHRCSRREWHILGNFSPPEAQNRQANRPACYK